MPRPEGEGTETAVRPGALSALLRELVRAPPDDAPSPWDDALRPGAVIGRFELVRELGRGGFGAVWEARDRTLGRAVAFKALTAGRGAAVEERVLAEAEAAARLSHPNIVTLHDVGASEHGPYLVFELLRGRALAARLAHGPLTAREAVRVATEVARGLAHAHAHGVVHRDLTPGNVFLCDDGGVKLLDLGLAHAFGRAKVDGGTPAYMAPEQGRGAPEDERSDVFALGVMLYEMLAGERPFRAPSGAAPGSSGRAAPELDVSEAPGLGALVARMMARDPVDRPRDGREVLAALEAFDGELSRAPSSGAAARVRRRRPRALRTAALVLAGVLLGAAVAALAARAPWRARRPEPSIAVLPFADLSPQKDQEYFSDGLSEEIVNALAHVEGLRVTGRTSAFAFKGRPLDLRTVAEELRVGAVLEGSVRKAGSRVRVTARVLDTSDGYDVWSETFDRDLGDIFAVQDEIARAVVAALKVKLLPGHGPTTREHRTGNTDAYAEYLVGRQAYARASPEGFRLAVAAFERAIALDPAYAPAWAGLAIPLYFSAEHERDRAAADAIRRRALAAAERAVTLDPALAEGWSARSTLRASVSWDWAGARADMDRALALRPGDATTLRRHGLLLAQLGKREEALAATRRAIDSDPLLPSNWMALASAQITVGDLAGARASIARVTALSPDYSGVHAMLGYVALVAGDAALAAAEFAQATEEVQRLVGAAFAEHALGHAAEAERAAALLEARYGDAKPCYVAAVRAWLGDRERAFAWLDRAYAQHDDDLAGVLHDRLLLRTLGDDPRFAALLRRMKLPEP